MPSEKSRYLNRNLRLPSPFDFTDLKTHLFSFGIERLVKIIWMSSERDTVLRKALIASIGIQLADGNFEKAKDAINYALDFPDYIRYYEHGYGFILDEIITTIKHLCEQDNKEFAINVAEYAFDLAHRVIENFEDDWDWVISLEDLENWIKKIKSNS